MCIVNIDPSNVVLAGILTVFTSKLYSIKCIRSSIIKTTIVTAIPFYFIAKSLGKFSGLDYSLCGLIGFLDVMVTPVASIVLLVRLIYEREVHAENRITSTSEKDY